METWTVRKLNAGDRIRVDRGSYFHHGIYIGGGEAVHFCAEDGDGITEPEKVEVRRTSMEEFARGSFCEVMELSGDRKKRRKPQDAVEYALKHIGQKGYDILNYNCEHFANECVFFEGYSSIVDETRARVKGLFAKANKKG